MSNHFAFPPFRMKRVAAAFYCGMSPTSFDRAVDAGELPSGERVTGGRYWLRQDLENAMVGKPAKERDFGAPI